MIIKHGMKPSGIYGQTALPLAVYQEADVSLI